MTRFGSVSKLTFCHVISLWVESLDWRWLSEFWSSSLFWLCSSHFCYFLMISSCFCALSTKWVGYFEEPDCPQCRRLTCRLWSGRPMVRCQLRIRSFLWVGSLGLNSKIMHRHCCICLQNTATRSEESSLHEFSSHWLNLLLCCLLKATFSFASEL